MSSSLSLFLLFTLLTVGNCDETTSDPPPEEPSLTLSIVNMLRRPGRDLDRVFYNKIQTCIRTGIEDTNVNCVMKQMYRVLKIDNAIRCKNCSPYFHCKASFMASSSCTKTVDSLRAIDTITRCADISVSDEDEMERKLEAAAYGRSHGACESLYLCSFGCRYSTLNETCTSTCR